MFPPTPADNFGSKIRTESPFSTGLLRRAAKTPAAYAGPNASRSAFARALSDESANETYNRFNLAGQKYQQQATEARAKDVQSRREDRLANYALQKERDVTTRQQDFSTAETRKDIDAYIARAKADYKTNSITNITNAIIQGGLLATALPGPTQMLAGMKAMYGGQLPATGAAASGAGSAAAARSLSGGYGIMGPGVTNENVFGNYGVGARPNYSRGLIGGLNSR